MRYTRASLLSMTGLFVALVATGCGGSSSVTGPEETPVALGAAVIQGTVVGGGIAGAGGDVTALSGESSLTVTVEGTSLSTSVDEEGEFILSKVPAGSVTLRFEGPGISARLTVSGLINGQVLSLQCHVSGSSAEVTAPAHTTPTKGTKITGYIESISGTRLVVGGHQVDASQVKKVWRGGSGTSLEHLAVGDKVKVWGTLRGDGVLVADEIQARSNGQSTWVVLDGTVTSVVGSVPDVHANPNSGGGSGSCGTASAGDIHANPNVSSCPTLYVDGVKVKTNRDTKFVNSHGGPLDPGSIRIGDHAYVEGWQESDKPVLATVVKIG